MRVSSYSSTEARGFVIYAGQGNLAQKLFRVATMGELSPADIDRLVECCGELLR